MTTIERDVWDAYDRGRITLQCAQRTLAFHRLAQLRTVRDRAVVDYERERQRHLMQDPPDVPDTSGVTGRAG